MKPLKFIICLLVLCLLFIPSAATRAFPLQAQSTPICGGPEAMNFLLLGIDENEQADAIRLMRIDFVNPSITILAIPRDLYVPIADMKSHNIYYGRINATYGYGEYFNGKGAGIASVLTNLEYNFNTTFDRQLTLHLKDVAKYIDILGGVDIELEHTFSDGYVTYKKGPHHFDGEDAVYFMRMRLLDSDFYRIDRQSQIFNILLSKAHQELTWMQILLLGLNFFTDKALITDVTLNEVMPLICLVRNLSSDDFHFVNIPPSMIHGATTIYGGSVQMPDPEVPAFVLSVMDGSYKP